MNDTTPEQDPTPSPGPEKIELGQEWTEKPPGGGTTDPATIANTPQDLAAPISTQGPPQAINREILGAITLSVLNVPSVVWGPHLVRTEKQIQPVVEPLALVLEKYDIDLDKAPEVMLILSSLGVLTGFIIDHRKHTEAQPPADQAATPGQAAPADQASTPGQAVGYFEKTPDQTEEAEA